MTEYNVYKKIKVGFFDDEKQAMKCLENMNQLKKGTDEEATFSLEMENDT